MTRITLAVLTFLVACVFGAVAIGLFAAGAEGDGGAVGALALVFLFIAIATGRPR